MASLREHSICKGNRSGDKKKSCKLLQVLAHTGSSFKPANTADCCSILTGYPYLYDPALYICSSFLVLCSLLLSAILPPYSNLPDSTPSVQEHSLLEFLPVRLDLEHETETQKQSTRWMKILYFCTGLEYGRVGQQVSWILFIYT